MKIPSPEHIEEYRKSHLKEQAEAVERLLLAALSTGEGIVDDGHNDYVFVLTMGKFPRLSDTDGGAIAELFRRAGWKGIEFGNLYVRASPTVGFRIPRALQI